MPAQPQRIYFVIEVRPPGEPLQRHPLHAAVITLYVGYMGTRRLYMPRPADTSEAAPEKWTRLGTFSARGDNIVEWTSDGGETAALAPGQPVPGVDDVFIGDAPPSYAMSTAERVRLTVGERDIEVEKVAIAGAPYFTFALQTYRDATVREDNGAVGVGTEGAAAFARSRGARLPTIDELAELHDADPSARLTMNYPWEWAYDSGNSRIVAVGNGGALHPRTHQRAPDEPGVAYFRLAHDVVPDGPEGFAVGATNTEDTRVGPKQPVAERRALVALSPESLGHRRPLACFADTGRQGTWLLFDTPVHTELVFVDRSEMRSAGLADKGARGGTVLDDGGVVLFRAQSIIDVATGRTLPIPDVVDAWGANINSILLKTSKSLVHYDGERVETLAELGRDGDGMGHPDGGWVVWRWDGSMRYDCTFGAGNTHNHGTRGLVNFYVDGGRLLEANARGWVDGFVASDGTTSSLSVSRNILSIDHCGARSEIDITHVTVSDIDKILQLTQSSLDLAKVIPFRLGGDGRIWHIVGGELFTDIETASRQVAS